MGIDTNIISKTVKEYGKVKFGKECFVGEYTIIGYPYVKSRKSFKTRNIKTYIGDRCIIGNHVVIYEGAKIGDGTRIEDFCQIGKNVIIGKNCYILYGAKIYDDTKIGNRCKIAGFCCERVKIGNDTRIFGELIHSHRDPSRSWDDVTERSPRIENDVFIGFGAKIIGGVKIGKNSYIKVGAIVTKNVPSKSVASGINEIVQYKKSRGKVKNSQFFGRLI